MGIQSATPEVGSLLDELVSNLPSTATAQRTLVAKYIVDKKMSRVNLTAALKFFKALGTGDFEVSAFEAASGIGIEVTPEKLSQKLGEICAKNEEELKKQGHSYGGKLIQAAKGDDLLKWVDGYVQVSVPDS